MVPRATLDRVRARFGSICNSATPDVSFTYRLCALDDTFLYLDRAAVIAWGYRYSHAFASYLKGDVRGTHADWAKTWGDRPWLEAAPIAGLDLGSNVQFHEYALVQREVGEERFPPIDHDGYLRELANGLQWIDDPARKRAMRRVLHEHGWREEKPSLLRRLRRRLSAALGRGPAAFATEDEAVQYLLRPRPLAAANPHLAALDAFEVPFGA
jgi:hypothetical protein